MALRGGFRGSWPSVPPAGAGPGCGWTSTPRRGRAGAPGAVRALRRVVRAAGGRWRPRPRGGRCCRGRGRGDLLRGAGWTSNPVSDQFWRSRGLVPEAYPDVPGDRPPVPWRRLGFRPGRSRTGWIAALMPPVLATAANRGLNRRAHQRPRHDGVRLPVSSGQGARDAQRRRQPRYWIEIFI
jgi:hypothetical protein